MSEGESDTATIEEHRWGPLMQMHVRIRIYIASQHYLHLSKSRKVLNQDCRAQPQAGNGSTGHVSAQNFAAANFHLSNSDGGYDGQPAR